MGFDQVVAAELVFGLREGTSVVGVLPPRTRTEVAVLVGCKASPVTMKGIIMSYDHGRFV